MTIRTRQAAAKALAKTPKNVKPVEVKSSGNSWNFLSNEVRGSRNVKKKDSEVEVRGSGNVKKKESEVVDLTNEEEAAPPAVSKKQRKRAPVKPAPKGRITKAAAALNKVLHEMENPSSDSSFSSDDDEENEADATEKSKMRIPHEHETPEREEKDDDEDKGEHDEAGDDEDKGEHEEDEDGAVEKDDEEDDEDEDEDDDEEDEDEDDDEDDDEEDEDDDEEDEDDDEEDEDDDEEDEEDDEEEDEDDDDDDEDDDDEDEDDDEEDEDDDEEEDDEEDEETHYSARGTPKQVLKKKAKVQPKTIEEDNTVSAKKVDKTDKSNRTKKTSPPTSKKKANAGDNAKDESKKAKVAKSAKASSNDNEPVTPTKAKGKSPKKAKDSISPTKKAKAKRSKTKESDEEEDDESDDDNKVPDGEKVAFSVYSQRFPAAQFFYDINTQQIFSVTNGSGQTFEKGGCYVLRVKHGQLMGSVRVKIPKNLEIPLVPDKVFRRLLDGGAPNLVCLAIVVSVEKKRAMASKFNNNSVDMRELVVHTKSASGELIRTPCSMWGKLALEKPTVGDAILILNAKQGSYQTSPRLSFGDSSAIVYMKEDAEEVIELKKFIKEESKKSGGDVAVPDNLEAYDENEDKPKTKKHKQAKEDEQEDDE